MLADERILLPIREMVEPGPHLPPLVFPKGPQGDFNRRSLNYFHDNGPAQEHVADDLTVSAHRTALRNEEQDRARTARTHAFVRRPTSGQARSDARCREPGGTRPLAQGRRAVGGGTPPADSRGSGSLEERSCTEALAVAVRCQGGCRSCGLRVEREVSQMIRSTRIVLFEMRPLSASPFCAPLSAPLSAARRELLPCAAR